MNATHSYAAFYNKVRWPQRS